MSTKSKYWWEEDPDERFWLYRFWDDSPESNLLPLLAESVTHFGQRKRPWCWSLISEIRPADVIFLWTSIKDPDNSQTAAFVGVATAASNPVVTTSEIDIRDVHLNFLDSDRSIQQVHVELAEHGRFFDPLTLNELWAIEAMLKKSRDDLQANFRSPPYGPWSFSELRPMEVTEGSVFKLPARDVELLGLLNRPSEPFGSGELGNEASVDDVGISKQSWRSRRLGEGESLPISQVNNKSLDAIVEQIMNQINGGTEEQIVSAVKGFLGMKKTTQTLQSRVRESVKRVHAGFFEQW